VPEPVDHGGAADHEVVHCHLPLGVVLLEWFPPPSTSRTCFAADNQRRHKLSPLVDRINTARPRGPLRERAVSGA
jgi:hypothetical protein